MLSTVKHLRSQFHEPCIADRFGDYHLSEQEIAGLWFTETAHPPFFQIPMHSHDAPSFYVVVEGSVTEVSKQTRRHLLPYSVVFTPPGEIHSNNFDDNGGRCLLVEFMPSWNERLASSRIYLNPSTVSDNWALGLMAARLYREFRFPDDISSLAIESITMEILVEFCRQRSPKFRPTWLQKAKELLHDRFSQTVTLGQIAEAVGVHPVHLSRTFRERYYCSFMTSSSMPPCFL